MAEEKKPEEKKAEEKDGVLLRDPYNLVAGDHLEPGEYNLAAGFYHPDTGERIPAAGPGGVPVESVPLLSFTWPLDE